MAKFITSGSVRARTVPPPWLTAAVLAAMPALLAVPAHGQARVGADGRGNDANNRVGSSGVNSLRPPPTAGVYGNNVVNGNVTQGREFRGSAPSSDLNAFRARSAGVAVDNFIKNSSGVGVPNTPPAIPNQAETFYGLSRNVAPPPGFTQTPNTRVMSRQSR